MEIKLTLNEDEIQLLIDALDSHEYWQLTEPNQRNDGYSQVEDGEDEEIDAARTLTKRLEVAREYIHDVQR